MNKIKNFFSDVRFEMLKVSWPNWSELKGSTFVVISFSILVSLFLFFIDRILSSILQVILLIFMNWYTLRVISGKEGKIKENLLFELDFQNLSSEVKDIMVPSENIVEMKEGKKRVKRKVFFPGYILINMSESKEAKYLIENTDGVINFVGANGEPQTLKDDEISRIIGEVEGLSLIHI